MNQRQNSPFRQNGSSGNAGNSGGSGGNGNNRNLPNTPERGGYFQNNNPYGDPGNMYRQPQSYDPPAEKKHTGRYIAAVVAAFAMIGAGVFLLLKNDDDKSGGGLKQDSSLSSAAEITVDTSSVQSGSSDSSSAASSSEESSLTDSSSLETSSTSKAPEDNEDINESEDDKPAEEPEKPVKIENKMLAQPVYPAMPPYPESTEFKEAVEQGRDSKELSQEYREICDKLKNQPEGYDKGIPQFVRNCAGVYLTEQDGKNKVFSPLSLYMALGMCSEITDGDSRRQILDILGQSDIEEMRSHAKSVWESSYKDDGIRECLIANSIWANYFIPCKQATADSIAENYYASTFSGDPASEEYNIMFRDWLNQQTGGMLTDSINDINLDSDTIIALASTVNYSAKWLDKFEKKDNFTGTFHAQSGDVECEFMHEKRVRSYVWGEKFRAISTFTINNGTVRLILPDEGYTPEDLFADDEALYYLSWKGNSIYSYNGEQKSGSAVVELSIPKFDITADTDLIEGLKKMGMTDAFDASVSDFTPITDEVDDVWISKATQSARVTIDEEGVQAAAATVMIGYGGGGPQEFFEFVLDRPFIFEIVGENGLPLFIGAVNVPL